jgi:hypothetical protein
MVADAFRSLRINLVILIVLLALQFELGMSINLSDLHTIPAFGFSMTTIFSALAKVGGETVTHGVLGTLLALGAIFTMIRSLATGIRKVQVVGVVVFVTLALAAVNGYLFVLSGYENDGYSHGMATSFIVSLLACFLELYFLKPAKN